MAFGGWALVKPTQAAYRAPRIILLN